MQVFITGSHLGRIFNFPSSGVHKTNQFLKISVISYETKPHTWQRIPCSTLTWQKDRFFTRNQTIVWCKREHIFSIHFMFGRLQQNIIKEEWSLYITQWKCCVWTLQLLYQTRIQMIYFFSSSIRQVIYNFSPWIRNKSIYQKIRKLWQHTINTSYIAALKKQILYLFVLKHITTHWMAPRPAQFGRVTSRRLSWASTISWNSFLWLTVELRICSCQSRHSRNVSMSSAFVSNTERRQND